MIGVTVSRRSGWRIFPLMQLSLWIAGARAVRWQSGSASVDLDAVDGVVIGGGDDIAPTLYGGELRLGVRLDPDRDSLEKSVIEGAFARSLPILGICRGSQMLNVVLGGDLHQDAYSVYDSRKFRTILPRKCVNVTPDSLLFRTTRQSQVYVNALHSQAVDRLGDRLRVAARDSGGMVQAIERTSDPFAMGVQWHPEHLFYRRAHRRIFAALTQAARARAAEVGQIAAAEEQALADTFL
ncbi:gamma-glutamyl-gamma-aminobutyrate hydrolase family protein [Puniceibacterium confluentis]